LFEEEEEEEDVPRQRSYFVFKIELNRAHVLFGLKLNASALSFCGFCCQNKGGWDPLYSFHGLG
jgi:hypothetical protein